MYNTDFRFPLMCMRYVLNEKYNVVIDIDVLKYLLKFFRMLKMYRKTENMIDLLYEFTTKQWIFENSNTKKLWSSLSEEDRSTFCYSLENYGWEPYLKSYYYGIRKHLLGEDQSNIEEAKKKNRKYDST